MADRAGRRASAEDGPLRPGHDGQDARDIWIEPPPGLTVVAVDDDRIVGTGKMGTNRPGPGSHVSTASFMVAADARGRGVGTALCRFALDWARDRGYAGMQFNAVAESNQVARRPLQAAGLQGGRNRARRLRAPRLGRVGLHVMYREL